MRARYYNPYLCRFISADPTGFGGGLNHFAYANGNPVSFSDPSGLNAAATGDISFTWFPGLSTTPVNLNDPFGLGTSEQIPSTWELFGNGLNNTVSAIGQSMGQGLFDVTHWTWSQYQYTQTYDQMYSTSTPANPVATPYVVGALGVSTVAAFAAGGAMIAGADPWLGDIAYHSAHATGPHQYAHIQIMIRIGESITSHLRIPLGW